ncbi:STAS domain-containing protein [Hydrogenimonas sp.]
MIIEKDELTIYDVEALHKELITEFDKSAVLIDMINVNKIDMSVIQLFVSAQKSSHEASKSFELKNVSQEVSNTLNQTACEFLLGVDNG